ncbi:MAG: thermonuclease family protein [Dehalococcoidia bacterium]|nr:thermonuclease family protein [Dehalococcoidia bacterium]
MKYRTKCAKIHDGDTFLTQSGKWIRLAGVNCTELGKYGSQKARNVLCQLIEGRTITYQPVSKSYHRIVAYVWVYGRSVNNAMRRLGYN